MKYTSNVETSCALAQMALRERATGTRFQIALERQRSCFIAKCDQDVEFPRAIPPRVSAFPAIVHINVLEHWKSRRYSGDRDL